MSVYRLEFTCKLIRLNKIPRVTQSAIRIDPGGKSEVSSSSQLLKTPNKYQEYFQNILDIKFNETAFFYTSKY